MAATAVLLTELAGADVSSSISSERAHADACIALATIVGPATGLRLAGENVCGVTSDWTNVLDAIDRAGATVINHQAQLKSQAGVFQSKIDALHKELGMLRAKLAISEDLLIKLQEQGDACIAHAHAQSEQQLQMLQSQMADRVRAAEDRARAAQDRAQTAEAWLQRIEVAAQSLIPLHLVHSM